MRKKWGERVQRAAFCAVLWAALCLMGVLSLAGLFVTAWLGTEDWIGEAVVFIYGARGGTPRLRRSCWLRCSLRVRCWSALPGFT